MTNVLMTQPILTISLARIEGLKSDFKALKKVPLFVLQALSIGGSGGSGGSVAGVLKDQGNYDASTNLYPATGGSGTAGAIMRGDLWTISVAGMLGGNAVTAGDIVRALIDAPAQLAINWVVTETNFGYVPVASNAAIVAGTKTKITFDSKGLIVSATDATTADIADSTDKRYVTDAKLGVLNNTTGTNTGDQDLSGKENTSNKDASGGYAGLTLFKLNLRNALNTLTSFFTTAATAARTWTMPDKDGTVAMTSDITGTNSGTNTGDQTITLTGDVTGSGTGSFAATIGNAKVTLAKQANMATSSVVYRKTAGSGAPEVQTLATLKTDLGLTGTNSGDAQAVGTLTQSGATTGQAIVWNGTAWAPATVSASPAGSTGDFQYNNAGAFASVPGVTYASNTTTILSQLAAGIPLAIQAATSQSGNLTEWRDSVGAISTRISSTGALLLGTVSTGILPWTNADFLMGTPVNTYFRMSGYSNGNGGWPTLMGGSTSKFGWSLAGGATNNMDTAFGRAAPNSVVQSPDGVAGSATSNTVMVKALTGIADATATGAFTVTVPNAAHSASIRVKLIGSLGAGGAIGANESLGTVEYDIAVARTAGVNAVATISSVFGSATAAVAGAATITVSGTLSAISGAVGATNTFTVNVTITKGSGASANHTCRALCELVNANASGITIA